MIDPNFNYWLAFATGIAGAFHCAGMCGGMASGFFAGYGWSNKLIPQLKYHGARIAMYILLAVLGALLGRVLIQAGIIGKTQGIMLMISGLLVMGIGLWLTGLFNRQQRDNGSFPQPLIVHFDQNPKAARYMPALAGLLNGFVPCSLLFSVAIKAVATADPLHAGLLMLCFGLGTLPTMAMITTLGAAIGQKSRGFMIQVTGALVILLGGWTMYEGWIFYDIMRVLAN